MGITDRKAAVRVGVRRVLLAAGSPLLQYRNAVGGEEDRRLAVKFLVKEIV